MIALFSCSAFFPPQLVHCFEETLCYKPDSFGPSLCSCTWHLHLCFPNISWETLSSTTCMSFNCVTFWSTSLDTADLYLSTLSGLDRKKGGCSGQNLSFCPSGLHLNAPSAEDNEFLSLDCLRWKSLSWLFLSFFFGKEGKNTRQIIHLCSIFKMDLYGEFSVSNMLSHP